MKYKLAALVAGVGIMLAGCTVEGSPAPERPNSTAASGGGGTASAAPPAPGGSSLLASHYEGTMVNALVPTVTGFTTLTFTDTSPGHLVGYLRIRVLSGSGNVTGTLRGSKLTLTVVMDSLYFGVTSYTLEGVVARDGTMSGTFKIPPSSIIPTGEWGTWTAVPA